jgi:hypothetical protein
MIATNLLSDTQFSRARELQSPVRVVGLAEFVLPSATRPELLDHHRVTFDSAEEPTAFSCTCEAHQFNNPCWAAARALEALTILTANGITLAAFSAEAGGGPASADITDLDGATDDAVKFDGPLPRFENRRAFKADPEPDPDAVLVAFPIRKVGKVEKVRGFTI